MELKRLLAHYFWHACASCLDDEFSLRLRRLLDNEDSLIDVRNVQAALRLWVRHARLTNMHLEKLLALCKASCQVKHPTIQRLVCTSLLSQWLHRHREAQPVTSNAVISP